VVDSEACPVVDDRDVAAESRSSTDHRPDEPTEVTQEIFPELSK